MHDLGSRETHANCLSITHSLTINFPLDRSQRYSRFHTIITASSSSQLTLDERSFGSK
jgi:hypothetical protein